MILSNEVKAAEKVYKDLLESFFIANYPKNHLISHGLDHHRRVWKFAKELIDYSAEEYPNSDFIQRLIIACYLHDIGLSIDPGIRHGLHSKKLCEKFLKQNNLPESKFQDVLHAIENHDDKEYKVSPGNDPLLTILSVADDLDAFGNTGVYRYAEIYVLRGVDVRSLGEEVQKNLKSRFENFKNNFAKFPEIIRKHEARFNKTDIFFRNYSEQMNNYDSKSDESTGYYGVIKIITEIINNKISLDDVIISHKKYDNDLIISTFIKYLSKIR